jgi:hypothetical protein
MAGRWPCLQALLYSKALLQRRIADYEETLVTLELAAL